MKTWFISKLRSKTKEIFYSKANQEVDFVCFIDHKIHLINVAYDISNAETYKREISGLLEAMQMHNVLSAFLINNEIDKIVNFDDINIHIIILWK